MGLQPTAGAEEIKAAFRRLVKQYHPDRNPNGKAFFEQVVIAYETLSDPQRKASYDYRLANSLPQRSQQSRTPTKNWTFTEKELKRRQYYNEHIRKYARATASYNAEADAKKGYNEFKYILLAVPLAVLLFLMIMQMATPVRRLSPEAEALPAAVEEVTPPPPRQGDSPYGYYFGSDRFFAKSDRALEIRNHTGKEVIVCLFADTLFVRSFFMQSGYSAEVMQLPPDTLVMRFASGIDFDYLIKPPDTDVVGGFSSGMRFYESEKPVFAGAGIALTLLPGDNPGFSEISAARFFSIKSHDKKD